MALPKIKFAGGGERGQYLTHKGNDTTIRFVLRYPAHLDADTLCAVVGRMVESVDILHSTFFTDAANAYWKVNEDVAEHHYFRHIQTDGDPMTVARSLSVYPVDHQGKAQLRCELVQNDRESVIVLAISHLCVDGGDGKYLLGKLVEGYDLLASGGDLADLTIKNGSRAPEQVYENFSPKDVKGMLKMPISTSATSAYPFPAEAPGSRRVTTSSIPASVMDAARKKGKGSGSLRQRPAFSCRLSGLRRFSPCGPRHTRQHQLHDGPAPPLYKRRERRPVQYVRSHAHRHAGGCLRRFCRHAHRDRPPDRRR